MSFISSGRAPLLDTHKINKHLGMVQSAYIQDNKVVATFSFDNTPEADAMAQKVDNKMRRNVSIGYDILSHEQRGVAEDGLPIIYVKPKFTEISICTIPLDTDSYIRSMEAEVNELTHFVRSDEIDIEEEIIETTPVIDTDTRSINTEENKPLREEKTTMENQIQEETQPMVVDNTEAVNASLKADRARSAEITKLGQLYNAQDLATRAVEDGKTVEQFKVELLDKNATRAQVKTTPYTPDYSEKEKKEFSMSRALNASATGNWRNAQFEEECMVDFANKSNINWDGRSIFLDAIPVSNEAVRMVRAQTVGTGSEGGNLVTNPVKGFKDAIYNASILPQLGIQPIYLQGNELLPVMNTTPTVYNVGEAVDVTASSVSFSQVGLTPKIFAAAVQNISYLATLQTNPSVEAKIQASIIKALAISLGVKFMEGAGGAAPTGVLNAGTLTPSLTLAANTLYDLNYSLVMDMVKQLANNNTLTGNLKWVMSPKMRICLQQVGKMLKSSTGTDLSTSTDVPIINDAGTHLLGYPIVEANGLSTYANGSATGGQPLIFGNFEDLGVGIWDQNHLIVDKTTGYLQANTNIAGFTVANCRVERTTSFVASKYVKTF